MSSFPAGFRFSLQRLSYRRRAADVAEKKNFYLEVTAFRSDLQHLTNSDFTSWLDVLTISLHSSQLAGSRRKTARLEESCSPKPFVDPYAQSGKYTESAI